MLLENPIISSHLVHSHHILLTNTDESTTGEFEVMSNTFAEHTLLLIDCQKGFDDPRWGERNNPHFEAHAKSLLHHWRNLKRNIIHVRHSSTEHNSPLSHQKPGFAYSDWAVPQDSEAEFVKSVNSCFIGTELEQFLKNKGIHKLVVLGLTTNHCISTSVRMAGNLGFDVKLVGDACAAFPRASINGGMFDAETLHQTALASLHGEFCTVVDAESITRD
jgi:nicotinamidase-related amidase